MVQPTKIDPVTRHVRSLTDRDYFLGREVAAMFGISIRRLRTLAEKHPETLGPGYLTHLGRTKIYLYTEADLAQLRAYFAYMDTQPQTAGNQRGGRGRIPIWSPAEHAHRHRQRALAYYCRTAAGKAYEKGDTERGDDMARRHSVVVAALAAQHAERQAALTAEHWTSP